MKIKKPSFPQSAIRNPQFLPLKMSDLDLTNKRVLIREDFNVPIENGVITNDRRIETALPTIKLALKQKAKIILLSHLGRPTEGKYETEFSLAPVAEKLSQLLKQKVRLIKEWLTSINVKPGQVVLCENVRFNKGEKNNDETLAKKMAALCDVFVMDAFGTAHRAEASTYGVAKFAPVACAGPLLVAEIEALNKALANPKRPMLAIVGGSKVSTKLTALKSLMEKVDQLIVGGGIANTFIAAGGYNVGKSLYEKDLITEAKSLIQQAKQNKIDIPIPIDVVVGTEFSKEAKPQIKNIDQVKNDEMILDIGPKTVEKLKAIIKTAGTIVWNGPVGVFEFDQFGKGTEAIAKAIAASHAYSLAGGGDTLAAIDKYHIADKLSYISTGGGAFLEYIEGKELPAIKILEIRSK
jgi:phosphoglycerate kinase